MVNLRAALACLCLAAVSAVFADNPAVVLVPKTPKDSDVTYALDFCNAMANQIPQNFSLRPIVWSLTDQEFRVASQSGLAPNTDENPTPDTVRKFAAKVDAAYIIWIEGAPKNGAAVGTIHVYRGQSGRSAWDDTQEQSAMTNGLNDVSTAQDSIVNLWILRLKGGLWKDNAHSGTVVIPDPAQGVITTPDPPPPAEDTVPAEITRIRQLAADKRLDAAILQTYEAIDNHPFRSELRVLLIDLLKQSGKPALALEAAQRALQIDPGNTSLRMSLLRALIADGRMEEAQTELNEAMARAPQDSEVLELAGNLAVLKGKPDQAKTYFLQSISKGAGARVSWSLACVTAFEGDTAEADHLIKSAQFTDPADRSVTEGQCIQFLRILSSQLGDNLARMIVDRRKGALKMDALILRSQRLAKAAEAMSMVVQAFQSTDLDADRQNKRLLAYKLLVQASNEVLEYVQSGDEDGGDEAEIDLAEALSRLAEADPR